MTFSQFDKNYKIEFYSGEHRIYDNENKKFIGDGFSCLAEANLFLKKLRSFLFEYDDLKCEHNVIPFITKQGGICTKCNKTVA